MPSRGGARGIYVRDAAAELRGGGMTVNVEARPLFSHAATRSAAELDEVWWCGGVVAR